MILKPFALLLGAALMIAETPLIVWSQPQFAVVPSTFVPDEVRQGYALLKKGWVKDAIAVLQRAVQRHPSSIEAKVGLAIAYRRAGQDEPAWTAYQAVLAQDPNNTLALKSVGILGGFRQQWQDRGIQALTTLLQTTPGDMEARAQRALLYGYQGRFSEAIADYEQALRGTVAPEILLNAAQVYTYAGEDARAIDLFERAGMPTQGAAAIAYARALRRTGQAAQAIRLLEAQPESVQARAELAQAYLDNQQPTQALAILEPLRDRVDARLSLARSLNEIGKQMPEQSDLQRQAARLYLQELRESTNPSPALVRETADVLSGIPEERQTALDLYRQLSTQEPNNKSYTIQRLAIERQLGTMSRQEIRRQLQAALQPLPSGMAERSAIARSLVRIEPDAEFLPVYQDLLRSGVNEPFLEFRMAQLLIDQGKLDEAAQAIARYQGSNVGKRDRSPELLLADIDRRRGEVSSAEQRYIGLIETGNLELQTGARRGLAGIRIAQSRYLDALALYDQLVATAPTDPRLQLARTAIAYQAKQVSAAQGEAVLDRFLANRPADSPEELYTLVSVLPARASREPLYAELIDADPTHVPLQVKFIQLLANRDAGEARRRARQLLARAKANRNSTDLPMLFLRGKLEQALGNFDRADDAYAAILKLQPDNGEALADLGTLRFQQRDFSGAAQLYGRALDINPDDTGIQRSIAELAAAQGYSFAALDQLERLRMQQGEASAGELDQRIQKLHEDILRQRGFQPDWERY